MHPEDLPATEAVLRRSMEQCTDYTAEYRVLWPDGTTHWVEVRGRFESDDAGKAVRSYGVLTDITERKQADEALAASRSQLQNIIDNTPAVIYAFDLEERFVMANASIAELLKSTPQQMIGKRRCEFMPKEDADWHEANDRQAIEAGRALEFEEHSQLQGRSITWLTTKFPLRDAQGNIYAVAGISTDISERKQAEEALRELNATLESRVEARTADLERERRRLYEVLEAIPAMVCLLTPDYHVAFANRGFREKFGESRGRTCYEYCFGRTQPCEFCETYEVLKTGRPHCWEVTGPDGRTIIEAHDYPFTDVDGSSLILEMDIDVTEHKRAEAALRELNETLSHRARQLQKLTLELSQVEERERRRIAVILHEDLQQQIAGAKFHLNTLGGRAENRRLRSDVEKIDEMLREAIEKSRGLSHDLSPAVLNMNDLTEVLRWLGNRVRTLHGLIVHVDTPDRLTLQSEAMTMFLFRAAQELLFNVVKHARVTEAVVRVRRARGFVCLCVSDKGQGFNPQELRDTAGFGLLSISERVGLLGGRMKIRSSQEKGSTVRMVVPDGGDRLTPSCASLPT